MKKKYFLPIFLLLFSCNNNKSQQESKAIKKGTITESQPAIVNTDTKQELTGNWKEHWGIGMETNVNSNDLFKIQLNPSGDIAITCPAKKKFVIDQILFDGRELSFRKQNKSYPKGKFYIYYRLKLHDDLNWMEGPVTNNKKQKDYVKWERVGVKE